MIEVKAIGKHLEGLTEQELIDGNYTVMVRELSKETKKCSSCKNELPLSAFTRHKNTRDGRNCNCRDCSKKYLSDYRKRPEYKEQKRRYNKKYNAKNRKKVKAWETINSMVLRGEIEHVTSLFCIACGDPAQEYHHPNGYSGDNALNIVPLCIPCHKLAHEAQGTTN